MTAIAKILCLEEILDTISRVFVRGGGGGGGGGGIVRIGHFDEEDFLPGEGNLRRCDFGNSQIFQS